MWSTLTEILDIPLKSRFISELGHLSELDEPEVRQTTNRWLSEGSLVFVEKYKPRSGGGGWYFALGSLEHFDLLVDESEPRHVVFLGRWRPHGEMLGDAIIRKVTSDQALSGGESFVALQSFFPQELDASFPDDEIDIKECVEEYFGKRGWYGRIPSFPGCYWERDVERPGILITRT